MCTVRNLLTTGWIHRALKTLSIYSLSQFSKLNRVNCPNILIICQKTGMDENAWSWQEGMDVHVQDIWLDKAEVCLSMRLYQPARQLLAEAHLIAVVS